MYKHTHKHIRTCAHDMNTWHCECKVEAASGIQETCQASIDDGSCNGWAEDLSRIAAQRNCKQNPQRELKRRVWKHVAINGLEVWEGRLAGIVNGEAQMVKVQ